MSKKSQFGMTLLLSTILVGGANASTVSTSNTLGAAMIAQQGAVCKGVVKDATGEPIIGASVSVKGTITINIGNSTRLGTLNLYGSTDYRLTRRIKNLSFNFYIV